MEEQRYIDLVLHLDRQQQKDLASNPMPSLFLFPIHFVSIPFVSRLLRITEFDEWIHVNEVRERYVMSEPLPTSFSLP